MADNDTISFSLVTGASSGIGFELAKVAAEHGSDLLIAADGPEIHAAAEQLRQTGVEVFVVQADLATMDGVDQLHEKYSGLGRPLDAIYANAGRGIGKAFLDQSFDDIKHVIDTNVTGTLYLLHRFVGDMRQQGWGKVLITGSIAGLMPGTYNAVYNGRGSHRIQELPRQPERTDQGGAEAALRNCIRVPKLTRTFTSYSQPNDPRTRHSPSLRKASDLELSLRTDRGGGRDSVQALGAERCQS
jgi:NAD(P)-dependent dehydrogenase (short-subunit alcohol dehydrogenase family)